MAKAPTRKTKGAERAETREASGMSVITYKYRVKDAQSRKHLQRMATACNQVWNYCVSTQRQAQDRWKAGEAVRWPSHFDLTGLTAGTSTDLGIGANTIGAVCAQFAASRDLHKRCPAFRVSVMHPEHRAAMLDKLLADGMPLGEALKAVEARAKTKARKASLGWIPFRAANVKLTGPGKIRYLKKTFRFWQCREIQGRLLTGAFVQDARGKWYVCLQCEVPNDRPRGKGEIGIDLGLKTLATYSNGDKLGNARVLAAWAHKLAVAQRAGNKNRVRAIHAKIKNVRKDILHKETTRIVRENGLIVVGNVNAATMAKSKFAKSSLDASWSTFRTMLRYKARMHGAEFFEADERFTSQACSTCGAISHASPKGMGGLGIREWTCSECGSVHDRDVNAARNILGLMRQPRADGIFCGIRKPVKRKQGDATDLLQAP